MKRTILLFGLLITALLFLFQLGKYRISFSDYTSEIVIAITSIVFFFAGIYYTRQRKITPVEPSPENQTATPAVSVDNTMPDYDKIRELGLSSRELDVLQELVKGHTNKQMADNLFISESTVKTHLSNLFNKLNVSNRTQAIIRSEELKLVRKDKI